MLSLWRAWGQTVLLAVFFHFFMYVQQTCMMYCAVRDINIIEIRSFLHQSAEK